MSRKADGPEDEVHIYYTNRSCHLASNYFYEFNWPDFHADMRTVQGNCEGSQWQLDPEKDVRGRKVVRKGTKMGETSSSESENSEDEYDKGREQDSEESDAEDMGIGVPEDESSEEEKDEDDESPSSPPRKLRTPSRKRKRNESNHDDHLKTPSKRRRRAGRVEPTPHSKAALRKRRTLKFKVKPPTATTQDNTTLEALPADPYLRAMHTLHVGERPDTLSCRDEEYVAILEAVLELLQETSGGCICEHSA